MLKFRFSTSLFTIFFALCFLFAASFAPFLVSTANTADKDREVAIKLNNLELEFDQPPLLEDGRVLVPFRAIAEALDVEVSWNNEKREVTALDAGMLIRLRIDDKTALVNREEVELDKAPLIRNGRTLVPLRFFSEAFDCDVSWSQEKYEVSIFSPPVDMWVTGFYALGSREASSWSDLFQQDYPAHEEGNTMLVDELALGWYSIDGQGKLLTASRTGWQRPSGWENLLEVAEEYGMRTEMVVHVTDYADPEEQEEYIENDRIQVDEGTAPEEEYPEGPITTLLSSSEAMQRGAREIATEAAEHYHGVNLNFEGLGLTGTEEELENVRRDFTIFVEKLLEELEAQDKGLGLTLTIHPPNGSYKGYDYSSLGELADKIIIMAHDYGVRPEPESRVKEAVEIALGKVPSEKLLLAISIPTETEESFLAKLEIARRHELKGVSLWRLGLLQGEYWPLIDKAVLPR